MKIDHVITAPLCTGASGSRQTDGTPKHIIVYLSLH